MDSLVRPLSSVVRGSRAEISLDDAFSVLADGTRRRLLVVLYRAQTPEPVPALTRNVAVETDRSGEDEIEHLSLRIYHVHVPKLLSVGFVEYDENRETVELTELGEAIARTLAREHP